MKNLAFFLLALVFFSCDKKKDDPAPQKSTAATTKNITIYVTRNDYYPNSTDYYYMDTTTLYSINADNSVNKSYKNNSPDKGPREFTNVGDSTFVISFQTTSSSGVMYGYPNGSTYITKGETNWNVDSAFVHIVYE